MALSEGIIPFGDAMLKYSNAVAGVNPGAVEASAIAAQSLVQLQTSLPNVGGVVTFFTGGNDLALFAAGIIPFGQAMSQYSNAVAGINPEAVTASAVAAQSLVQLQNALPNVGGVMTFFTGGSDLATFAANIAPFGDAMLNYSNAIAGVNPEAVTASASAGQALGGTVQDTSKYKWSFDIPYRGNGSKYIWERPYDIWKRFVCVCKRHCECTA